MKPSPPRILIVEDDESLRWGLEHNFRREGYQITSAEDGIAGHLAALDEELDLIILDIMLPEKSGYEVCREVRRKGLETPILMLTAKGQETDIVRGLDLGADDYVTKPFSIQILLARARALLRRREGDGAGTEFHFGNCVLDLDSHTFQKGGQYLDLTSKEFGLLAYLVRNPGRALTRANILSAVWGSSLMVSVRSVDRCITTLRGKVEENPKRPQLIQTIRDVGYRFEG